MITDVKEHEASLTRRLTSPNRGYIGRVSAAIRETGIKPGERARLTVLGPRRLKISRETLPKKPRKPPPPKTAPAAPETDGSPGNPEPKTMRLSVAKEFSTTPGPRYKSQGPDSGEAFRDTLLEPTLTEAETSGAQLTVDLDGSQYGYPVGWLEETFGGFIRAHGRQRFNRIHLAGSDDGAQLAIEEIRTLTDDCSRVEDKKEPA